MTERDQEQAAEALFKQLVDVPTEQRRQQLDALTVDEPALASRVGRLLDALDAAGDFLSPIEPVANVRPEDWIGQRLGDCEVLGLLGEGGMGIVLRAQQDEPNRPVAIKVLRSAFPTRAATARFEREIAAMGRLSHPGIARVYGAGRLQGRGGSLPYLIMELIHGEPLDMHMARRHLDLNATLELVARLCDAVDHAHEHGIVHRDLKPANVLVDDSGRPVVLDFGIARQAKGDGDDPATMQTTEGALVGTLAYMAPEQARGQQQAVSPATDVYALGVLLFEGLAGRRPHDIANLTLHEAVRVLCDEPAPRLGQLRPNLRGDLEVIVGKALAKDPRRRYERAGALAADIRRHLASEPIHARPPSSTYRLSRFVRRHRIASAAFLVVLIAAVAAVAFAVETDRAREDADARAAERDQLTVFYADLFASIDPKALGVRAIDEILRLTDAALMREGVPEEERAARVADLEGALLSVDTQDLGRELVGQAQLEPARALLDARSGDMAPSSRAELLAQLSQTFGQTGRYDDAVALAEQSLTETESIHGRLHEKTLQARFEAAKAQFAAYRLNEALDHWDTFLEDAPQLLSPDDDRWLLAQLGRAQTLATRGEEAPALALLEEHLPRAIATLGPDDSTVLVARRLLAQQRFQTGEVEAGLEQLESLRQELEASDLPEHRSALESVTNHLGAALGALGRHEEALAMNEAELTLTIARVGAQHPDALITKVNLAITAGSLGHVEHSLTLLQEVLGVPSDGSWQLERIHSMAWMELGWHAADLGRPDDAVDAVRRGVALRERVFGPRHALTANAAGSAVAVMVRAGRPRPAIDLARHWLDALGDAVGPGELSTIHLGLGLALLRDDQPVAAEQALGEARVLRAQAGRSTASIDSMIGEARLHTGDEEAGLPLLTSTLDELQAAHNPRYPEALEVLIEYHLARDEMDQTAAYRARLEGR